ncbi:aspartate-semialdehyde dehydrogenase [Neisseriaceae bacterium TC5R-5]|nr:aspartate-semialdehyde dehydrogenase [Neisseriaceae bacterium TC5R-5]
MSNETQLAVVGASSLVGQAVLELLAEHKLPLARVFAVDVADKAGETVAYGNLELDMHALEAFDFEQVSIVIFAAGSELAREFVPQAQAAGAAVVDFSSAFRLDEQVPLIVPGINSEQLADAAGLVAVPNCTVTPLVLALAPLRALGMQRLTVTTYQAVSGSGQAAMEELAEQTTALFSHRDTEVKVYPKRIAFNVLPQIGELDEEGVSEEERSVMVETRRLLGLPDLSMEVTCVRVPVFFGHAWSVSVQLSNNIELEQIQQQLRAAGLQVLNQDQHGGYITPMEATGNAGVWISRLRQQGQVLSFWLAADNVKTGAALPCVKIAQLLLQQQSAL